MRVKRDDHAGHDSTTVTIRSRILIAALLLVLTAAGGVAARITQDGGTSAPPTGTPGQAHFMAIGKGPVHFTGRLDRTSVLAGGDGLLKMELVIRGEEQPEHSPLRVATDLVVVLDRSGSMAGAPITYALAAVRELVAQLAENDRFSLVTYASGATTVIPMEAASKEARQRWIATIDRIGTGGGTNMAAGLDLATGLVDGHRRDGRGPRIVLLSDGHANEGDHSFEGLLERARRAMRGEYALSAVGVGDGFDEALMTALADAGTGNFYYVRRSDELGEVFASEFASARENMASALQVVIHPAAGVEVLDAAGYPLERRNGRVSFRPGSLFAGQERRIWVSLRMPTLRDRGDASTNPVGSFELAYKVGGARESIRFSETPMVAVAEGQAEFIASIDKAAWAAGVIDEEVGDLKQKVAGYLREAKPGEARRYIFSFRQRQEALNEHVGSERVGRALAAALGEMEEDLDREMASPSSAGRNSLSKKYSADGLDQRRQGAKH